MVISYIGIGSNIGDRYSNIIKAIKYTELVPKIKVIKISNIYETSPVGYFNQPYFLNCVIEIKTNLSPEMLLLKLQKIENILGRKRNHKNSPRTIDLDILFYEDKIISTKNLIIPHPELDKRKFVLKPLSELKPQLIHPVLNKTVKKLLNELNDKKQKIKLFNKISTNQN